MKFWLLAILTFLWGQVQVFPKEIPSTLFGIHQGGGLAGCDGEPFNYAFTDLGTATLRTWDVCHVSWAYLNPSSGVYDFKFLDILLKDAKTAGMADVFLQLGNTPSWISSNPNDTNCSVGNGYCDPPTDLNKDGSGTDLSWRLFVQNLALHVTNPSYLQTHATPRYWEIWNESERSDTLLSSYPCTPASMCAYRGTYAQMLRMVQDMKCILKGIPTDPITGLGKTCGAAGYGQIGIYPKAKIAATDGQYFLEPAAVLENFLRCDDSPPAGQYCTWSASDPLGSYATDMIVLHMYTGSTAPVYPEQFLYGVARFRQLLSAADKAKPFFSGEGSWGLNSTQTDPNQSAGFVARYYLTLWMMGMTRGYWFEWSGWDSAHWGGLWSPEAITYGVNGEYLTCQQFDEQTNGYWCTGAIAYKQTMKWLVNANAVGWTCPDYGGCGTHYELYWGKYTFDISDSTGYQGEIAWDNTQTGPCKNPQCGSTAYAAPSYVTQWRDLAGKLHIGKPTQIGAEPILSENFTRRSPTNPIGLKSTVR